MVLILVDFSFKVSLAMEAGYLEKVDELCERYSLEGFLNVKGMVCVCFLVLPWASYSRLTGAQFCSCSLKFNKV